MNEEPPTDNQGREQLQNNLIAELEPVESHWEDLQEDIEETASEYRENGWDVITTSVGNVTLLNESLKQNSPTFDILIPDNKLAEIKELVETEDTNFDKYTVYRQTRSGVIFYLIVMEDPRQKNALLFPAYVVIENHQELLSRAKSAEEVSVILRNISDEDRVRFSYDNPDLFFGTDG